MIQPDYYKILQIDPDAEPDIVKAVYRRLSLKYHPDGSHPDPARMAMINEAYEVISDVVKRARYDDFRRRGVDFPRSARPPHSRTETPSAPADVPPDFTYQQRVRRWRSYRAPGPSLSVVFGSMIVCAFIAVMLLGGASADNAARGRLASTAVRLWTPTPQGHDFAVGASSLRSSLLQRGFQLQPRTEAGGWSDYIAQDSTSGTSIEILDVADAVRLLQVDFERGSDVTADALLAQAAHQEFILEMLFPDPDRQSAEQWISLQSDMEIDQSQNLIGWWNIRVSYDTTRDILTVMFDSQF